MDFKKTYLLLITLIFLFCISTVSAQIDNETTDNLTTSDVSEEVVTSSSDEEVLSATTGTFYDLYSNISSATSLTLKNDYKYTSSDNKYYYPSYNSHYFSEGLLILKSMTINGNGHSIDGAKTARAFYINANNVVLKNIVFKNAVGDHGGAIFTINGTVTITNCTFINCISYDGAAVFSLNTTLTLTNNTFRNNSVWYSGGAIYEMYGNLAVNNCNFISNEANDGGAICADAFYSLSIINTNFTQNYAGRYGGAVAISFNSVITTSNNKFTSNTAGKGNDIYYIEIQEILDTSSYVDSLLEFFPDDVTTLPEYYDLRKEGYLTEIKDQGSDGNCWAFAALCALESALLKATGQTFDFSENNMKNLIAKYSDYGKNVEVNDGGSYWTSISYLSSWLGPIDENDDPYIDNANLFSDFLIPLMHIQDVVFIKRTNVSDLNGIKKAIMKYGAVATNLYSSSAYYSTITGSWYCPNDYSTNHAICLVGWNDTYSRYNFKTTPEGDGAWIMRNSWGDDSGDGGYFYVSYYDKTLALDKHGYSYAFSFNNTVNYEHIYQNEFIRTNNFLWNAAKHNINESEISKTNIWFKNVYNATRDEFLAAVSTWFDYTMNYDITINVTHNGVSTTYNQKGYIEAGYHTIKLNKYIPLQAGDSFSVMFKSVGIHWFASANSENLLRNFSLPGVSYASWNGKDWKDLSEFGSVACIKAFTISKVNTNVTILDFTTPKVNDTFNIAVKVIDEYGYLVNKGNVTFIINNTKYVLNTTNGIANLTLKLPKSGIYNLQCIFNASNYYGSNKTRTFEVKKHDSSITINVNNINYKQALGVNVTVSSNATGKVLIKINTTQENLSLSNNKVNYTFNNLKAGNYYLNVTYYGDEYYYGSSKSTTFTVNKITPEITIGNIGNVIYGNDVNVIYTIPSDVSNNVNISIYKNNLLVTSKSTSERSVKFSNLDAGDYIANVSYNGDSNYLTNFKTLNFSVKKAASSIVINTINNINYGGSIIVTPTLTNGTEGSYTLLYNSKTLKTGSFTSSIVFNNLDSGNYTLTVVNNGDSNHNSSKVSGSFEVFKISSQLSLNSISDIIYGNDLTVEFNSVSGNVKVTILKNNQIIATQTVSNKKATFKNLNASSYNITVEYVNDTNYYDTVKNTSVTVKKAKSSVAVSGLDNITYGKDYIASITMVNATSGSYKLYLESSVINASTTSNQLVFSNLNVGNYTLEVNSDESTNYNGNSTTFKFEVVKAESKISLENIGNITYGDELEVNVKLVNGTSGSYELYLTSLIRNGDINNINLSNLNSGNYTLIVYNEGDENHNPSNATYKFSVNKKTLTLIINEISDVVYNNTVLISYNLESNIKVSILKNNTLISNKSVNKSFVEFDNLNSGDYKVLVEYLGDENHEYINKTATFSILKANSSLTLENVKNITYGENLEVTVKLVNGTTGRYKLNNITGDINNIELNNLNAGNYTLIVFNDGDENHNPSNTTYKFSVNKKTLTLIINEISDVVYNNTVLISYNLEKNIKVSIFKNNTLISNKSVDESFVEFDNLNSGDYKVLVEYLGDENHNYINNTKTFSILKANSSLTLENVKNITYGDELEVNVNLVNGTSGSYKLNNLTGDINNIDLSNINAGNYTLIVFNDGDENHNPSNATYYFTVAKKTPTLIIEDIQDVVYNNTVLINFNLRSNVKVSIFKNNTLISNKTVNNTFVEFESLNSGDYDVLVEYLGDNNYNYINGSSTFKVLKAESKISLDNVKNITYGDELEVNINLVNGTTGSYKLNNITGDINNIDLNNLNAGNYTLIVFNDGDENHNPSNATYNFTVNKKTLTLIINDISDVIYNNTVLISYNLEKNIKVSIFKNNTLIINKSVDKNSVEFNNLNSGDYEVLVEYLGDKNHEYINKTATFSILKATSSLTLENVKNITYSENLEVIANLVNGTTGRYKLNNLTGDINNIDLNNLNTGNYTLIVFNDGDENHNPSNATYNFTVNKKTLTLTINEISDIIYNNTVLIIYNLESNIKVSIFKNNTLITNITTNNNYVEFDNLDSGDYDVLVEYLGDENHNYINNTKTFTILKANSTITVENVKNITYGDELEVNINLVNGTTGNYTLNNQTGDINNLQLNNLNAGNYTLIVFNDGDKNHKPSNATYYFTVAKKTPTLIIEDISDVIYDNTVLINFNLENNVKVSIFKNNTLISNKTIDNNFVEFENLNSGDYEVLVEYLGDNNYNYINGNSAFKVLKAESKISLDNIKNITYGDELEVNVNLVNGTTGSYKLNNITGDINNIELNNLNAGNYTLIVFNDGDENHNPSNQTYTFTVAKKTLTLTIDDIQDVVYNNTVLINYNLENNIKVSIFKNNTLISDKSVDKNSVEFENLDSGNYDVLVEYLGDENHNYINNTKTFTILKANSSISVENLKNITYGEDLEVNVKLVNGTSGNYTLNNITGDIDNIELNNLNAGNYTLIVFNNGDENHNPSNATYNFTVAKKTLTLTIEDISDIIYNNTLLISYNLENNIKVSIFKNNTLITNITTNNHYVEFDNLDSGDYYVLVEYLGDENHNYINNTKTFTILKANSSINVENIKNITYGDELEVKLNLVNGTTGIYELYLDSFIKSENINNLNLTNLNAGNYTLIVYNEGDKNHNPSNATYNFTVAKKTLTLIIEDISDIIYNNTVLISYNLENNIKVSIFKNNTLISNKTVNYTFVEFENLTSGDYDVLVEYLGNNNYNYINGSSTFKVLKAESKISLDNVKNITYDDELEVNVNLVNGTTGSYKLNNITGDINNIKLTNLNAGNYTLIVFNDGDENHNPSNQTYTFTVAKKTLTLIINNISDVVYNNTVLISYNLENNIKVNIFKNNTLISNKSVDKNSIEFENLDSGNYDVLVEYLGDENHEYINKTATFTILKANSTINVENLKNITYDENLEVNVKLTNGTTGNYTLNNLTGNINNINLNNLNAGNYTLIVFNDGDENHNPSNQTYTFTVAKKTLTLIINDVSDVVYNNTVLISYNLENNIKVNIFKNNTLISNKTVNNTFVEFENLTSGDYNVLVEYLGDENHNYINNTKTFTILKANSSINVENLKNITYGEDLEVDVKLVNGTTGNYTLNNLTGNINNIELNNLNAGNYTLIVFNDGDENHNPSNQTYTFTVAKKTRKLIINEIQNVTYNNTVLITYNLENNIKVSIFKNNTLITNITTNNNYVEFSNLDAGNYTVLVEYLGNENYNYINNTTTFTILKASSSITLENITNITYGDNLEVIVNLVNGTTGNYTLNNQTGDINNIELNNLNAGNYTLIVFNDGDENHNPFSQTYTFTVAKKTPELIINEIQNIIYNNSVTITFNLTNSNVSIFKDNTFITSEISNGEVEFNNLNAGLYTVNVEYLGDDNYNGVNASSQFNVFKAESSIILDNIKNITYGDKLTPSITLINGTTGNYTLNNLTGDIKNLKLNNLNADNYILTVFNDGDENHNPSNITQSFTVLKATPTILINSIDDVIFNSTLTVSYSTVTYPICVSIIKDNIVVQSKNTTRSYADFDGLAIGDYNLEVKYLGSANYNSISSNTTFRVVKAPSSVIIKPINLRYKDKFNVDITYINGSGYFEVKKSNQIVDINNLTPGSYKITAYNEGDENHSESKASITFNVLKAYPKVKINEIDAVIYGREAEISFTSNALISYNIKVLKDNNIIYSTITNETTLKLPVLEVGKYNIIINCIADDNYNNLIYMSNFEVLKATSTIEITSLTNITYGDTLIINTSYNNSQIRYYILNTSNNKNYFTDSIVINNLNSGEYTIEVVSEGSENYTESKDIKTFTVFKSNSSLTIDSDIYLHNQVNISYSSKDKLTGLLEVNVLNENILIYNKTYNIFDEILLNDLNSGKYTLKLNYLGDNNYFESSAESEITVKSVISNINISIDTNKSYEVVKSEDVNVKNYTIIWDNKTINISVDNSDNLKIIVNNKIYNNISNLKLYSPEIKGFININVDIDGIKTQETYESTLKVKSQVNITNSDNQLLFNLSDACGNLTITINNKTSQIPIIDGNAIFDTTNLDNGNYTYTLTYYGDDIYEKFNYTSSILINNTYKTKITVEQNDFYVTIKLTSNTNLKNYNIIVKYGKTQKTYKTNSKGEVVLKLKPKTYTIKVTFKGNGRYLSSKINKKIIIKKQKTKINAKAKTFKVTNKVKKYTITLKNIKKSKVTLKIKNKKYSAKTNSKGKAIFKLKNLKVGTYKAKITFKGNAYYKSVKKTVKIKVMR